MPSRNIGLAGKFAYGFDERYLCEFNFGYNGSEKFAENNRFGFFPSFGVGYLLSSEKFWLPIKDYVHNLKFKLTYGLVGNDAIAKAEDRFFFLSDVDLSGAGVRWGRGFNQNYSGYKINRYANTAITWEIAHKYNLGVELGLGNFIDFQMEVFKENRTNIYMERKYVPGSVGLSSNLYGNVGEVESKGFDGSADLKYMINNDFWITARGNFTYATNKIIENEEPQYKYDYLSKKGHAVMQSWGLVAERLFIDENDIKNSPNQTFGPYQPGDIKYKDINNDGKIDDNDQVAIGNPTSPEIIYGFGVSVGYKGFDCNFFMQGAANSSFFINPNDVAPFIERRNALEVISNDYWSKNNPNPHAFWPRLSTRENKNNTQTSTKWLRDGSFLRLKMVELGYSLPKSILKSFHMEKFRLYISGNNLYTFSDFDLWDVEMGGNGLAYPIQKVFNVGIQVGF